ncbi:UNVERIFIED_CONTAM: hypothetical protein RMT77_016546 [Armadillidium vulgare]
MQPYLLPGFRTRAVLFILILFLLDTFTSAQSDFNPFISYPRKFTGRSVSQPDPPTGHRSEPPSPRPDRSSNRRNLFFPPPDRLSPTRRPILSDAAGAVVSSSQAPSTPPPRQSVSRFHPSSSSKFSTGSKSSVVTKTTKAPDEYEDAYYYDDYYYDDNGTTLASESLSPTTESNKKPLSALVASNSKFNKNPVGFSKFHSGHFPLREKAPVKSPQPHSEIPPLRFRFSQQDNKERTTRPPVVAQTPSSSRKSQGLLADLISQLRSNSESENPASNFVDSNRQSKQYARPVESVPPVSRKEVSISEQKVTTRVSTESTIVTKPVISLTKKVTSNSRSSSSVPTEFSVSTTQDFFSEISTIPDSHVTLDPHITREEGKRFLDESPAKENLPTAPLEEEDGPPTTDSFSTHFENIHIAVDPSLLPPGYSVDDVVTEKVSERPETSPKSKTIAPDLPQSTIETIISTIIQEDVTAFLPPGYSSTAAFESTTEESPPPEDDKTSADKIDKTSDKIDKTSDKIDKTSDKIDKTSDKIDKTSDDKIVNISTKEVDPFAFLTQNVKPSEESKPEEPIPGVVVKTVDVSAFLPPGFKPEKVKQEEESPIPGVVISTIDVSKFLPPGFKPSTESSKANKKEPTPEVVVKKVDVSSFLPKGYKPEKEKEEEVPIPGEKILNVDVSKFLPKGFKLDKSTTTTEASSSTTNKVGPSGIVFPRRPKRPQFLSTTTTTSKPTASGPPPVKPKIQNLFDRVKALGTTEYTVPVVTEKIKPAESADIKEATTASTTSTTTTTTTTESTTTIPPIPTTPGICGSKCRLAASLRLISGTEWHPELANRDTLKFQELANDIENELDAFFRSSSISLWYDFVEVDSFNKGSVIVSYILSLSHIEADVDTKDLKEKLNTDLERVAHSLGKFTVDPDGTDFIVIPEKQVYVPDDGQNFLIPEWLIAVIVIGLASFLFILIFGVVALVSRARVRKRANVPLTEEFLNNLNALQVNGIDNYAMNGMYDLDPVWNEKYQEKYQEKYPEKAIKPPSSHGKGYNPEYNVNIYDSWRTDYSGPNTSSSANHSNRRAALDFEGRQFYRDDPYDF